MRAEAACEGERDAPGRLDRLADRAERAVDEDAARQQRRGGATVMAPH